MATYHIIAGDTGRPLDYVVGVDISDFLTFEIIVRSPTGVRKVFSVLALTPGRNDSGRYQPTATDFDEHGIWLAQAHVIQPGGLERRSLELDFIHVGEQL